MNPNLGVGFISIFWHLKFLASSSPPFGRIRNGTPHTSLRQSRHSQQKPSTDRWASAAPESDCLPCLCSPNITNIRVSVLIKSEASMIFQQWARGFSNLNGKWNSNTSHPIPGSFAWLPPISETHGFGFRGGSWPRALLQTHHSGKASILCTGLRMKKWVCLEMWGFFSRKNDDKPYDS